MSEYAHASLANKHTNGKALSPKKLQKRYHKLEEDLADAQEALEEAQEDLKEAQERLSRSERCVQKRATRIQKIRQKIIAARISLGEDVSSDPELASWLVEDDDPTPLLQTEEIPAITPAETVPAASNGAPVATEEETTEQPVVSIPEPQEVAPVAAVEETIKAPVTSLPEEVSSESVDPVEETLENPTVSLPEEATSAPVAAVEETIDAPVATVEETAEEPVASLPQDVAPAPIAVVEETAEEPVTSIQEEAISETSATTEEAEIPTSTSTAPDNEPTELVSESALEEIASLLDTAELSETSATSETSPTQETPVAASETSTPIALLDEQTSAPASAEIPPTPVAPASPAYGLRAASAPAERQTDEIVAVRVPSSLQTPTTEEASTPLSDDNSTEPSASSSATTLTDPPIPDDQDQPSSAFTAIAQAQERVVTTETQGVIEEANTVAEAAEEAANLAAERLFEFEQRLDQFVAGRHLEQDLIQLQAEVERTEHFAFQARQAVSAVETQTSLIEPAPSPSAQPQAELFDADSVPFEIPVPPSSDALAETETPTIEDAPPLEEIAEIDREEEALEATVSASITADAQRESERVEAYAEASGARAQEARALVERVSLMVDMVVAAIDSGILTGTNADEALAAAEQEMSSAQAVLTALDIITERADSYSAQVEARAEVSEGMSYASEENWRKDTRLSNDLAQIEPEPA